MSSVSAEAFFRRPTVLAWCAPLDEAAGRAASDVLLDFTPAIWRSLELPCCLWVEGYGVEGVFGGLRAWCELLAERFPRAAIVCGAGAWSVALLASERARTQTFGVQVYAGEGLAEARATARLPLSALALNRCDESALEPLALDGVGALLKMPRPGIRQRFGERVADQLDRIDRRGSWLLEAVERPEPVRAELRFEDGVSQVEPLIFYIKRLVHPLLQQMAKAGNAVSGLAWSFQLDRAFLLPEAAPVCRHSVAPAEATLVELVLIELVRLKLHSAPPPAPVLGLEVTLTPALASAEQLRLFSDLGGRDRRAGDEALARLRAEFGDSAVCRAVVGRRHLPEARVEWRTLVTLDACAPPESLQFGGRRGIRRFFDPPRRLPRPPEGRPWCPLGAHAGAVGDLVGPFPINGRWWAPVVDRVYWFAPLPGGRLLWVFQDKKKARWYLAGWLA